MKVEHLSRDQIIRQIALSFRTADESTATYLGVIAEHLRAGCLVMEIGGPNSNSDLASSIQLCKQTYRRVKPLFPDLLGNIDEIREELDCLQYLGDLSRIGGRYVSVAPGRRLEIDSESSLLLGGGPLDVFPATVQRQTMVSGRSRIITSALSSELQQAYPLQRIEDWLGLEDEDMLKWANDFVFAKVKTGSNDYIPDGLRIWDGRFWHPLEDFKGADALYLCRRNISLYGNLAHEYGLIKCHHTSRNLRIDSYVAVEKEVARKLQGALRPAKQKAEQFFVTKGRRGIVEVTLRHPIAKQHSKLLLLGWKAAESSERELGAQKFEFSERLLPLLAKGFSLIGYELIFR